MPFTIVFPGNTEPTVFANFSLLYPQAQRCVDCGEASAPCQMGSVKTTAKAVVNEHFRRIEAWRAKKEVTHKKIFVGDGVTHLSKKAVWIRR